MSRSGDIRDIITFTVPIWFFQADIGQNIELELNHTNDTEWLGILKCEVLQVLPDLSVNEVTYVVRAFEELSEFTDLAPEGGLGSQDEFFFVTQDDIFMIEQ